MVIYQNIILGFQLRHEWRYLDPIRQIMDSNTIFHRVLLLPKYIFLIQIWIFSPKITFFTKISNFDRYFDFSVKFGFLSNFLFSIKLLTNISIFDTNFDFLPKFIFFDQKLYFTKISIFEPNLPFWAKFRFRFLT